MVPVPFTVRDFNRDRAAHLVRHVTEYLKGNEGRFFALMPHITTGGDMEFTFSDGMCGEILRDSSKVAKSYEVALKYGFRGYSTGGRNGVFLIRDLEDGNLGKGLDLLRTRSGEEIGEVLGDGRLTPIKIVWHQPSGERVVGLMTQDNSKAMFLGYANY